MKRSWYLGLDLSQVAQRCILVGDPGRIDAFRAYLEGAEVVTERRGLRTITGRYAGTRVTISAFGMGAPIAAVVMDELALLGTRAFLRAGTVMTLDPDRLPLGSFLVANAAIRHEGASQSYAPPGYPAVAGWRLLSTAVATLDRLQTPHRVGLIASDDGFYTHLFPIAPDRESTVDTHLAELRRLRVLAVDMETSAVLTVGSMLGAEAGSLCLASVDATTRERLQPDHMAAAERQLCELSLRVITAVDLFNSTAEE